LILKVNGKEILIDSRNITLDSWSGMYRYVIPIVVGDVITVNGSSAQGSNSLNEFECYFIPPKIVNLSNPNIITDPSLLIGRQFKIDFSRIDAIPGTKSGQNRLRIWLLRSAYAPEYNKTGFYTVEVSVAYANQTRPPDKAIGVVNYPRPDMTQVEIASSSYQINLTEQRLDQNFRLGCRLYGNYLDFWIDINRYVSDYCEVDSEGNFIKAPEIYFKILNASEAKNIFAGASASDYEKPGVYWSIGQNFNDLGYNTGGLYNLYGTRHSFNAFNAQSNAEYDTGKKVFSNESGLGENSSKHVYRRSFQGLITASSGSEHSLDLLSGIDKVVDCGGYVTMGSVTKKAALGHTMFGSSLTSSDTYSSSIILDNSGSVKLKSKCNSTRSSTVDNSYYWIWVEYTRL
jgi:hypothetical protein